MNNLRNYLDGTRFFRSRIGKALGAASLVTLLTLPLGGCDDSKVPPEKQESYNKGEPILITKSKDGIQFYHRNIKIPKYDSKGNITSYDKELIKFIIAPNGNITTQWTEPQGKTTVDKEITVINGKPNNTDTQTNETAQDQSLITWLKLTPIQQESLGLPKSNDPKYSALIGLSEKQRKDLGLEDEYKKLLELLKAKKNK